MYEVCCGHRFNRATLRLTVHAVCRGFFSFLLLLYALPSLFSTCGRRAVENIKDPYYRLGFVFFFFHLCFFVSRQSVTGTVMSFSKHVTDHRKIILRCRNLQYKSPVFTYFRKQKKKKNTKPIKIRFHSTIN